MTSEVRMKILIATLILSLSLLTTFSHAGNLTKTEKSRFIREANAALAKKDYKTAFSKFFILAKDGMSKAQFNLGAFYLNGQGTQKNEQLAYSWFQKSAAQGNSRALKIIERAAARGNVFAKSELRKLRKQTTPAVIKPRPKAKPKPKRKIKPRARAKRKIPRKKVAYSDPTFPPRNRWVYGISADYSRNKVSEPLPYSVSGVTYTLSQSYNYTQPGINAWVGFNDITVLASYRRGNGQVNASIAGGTISKSFSTSDIEVDVRWWLRQYSSSRWVPFALAGYVQKSSNGTQDELEFQDIYTQKDRILLLGAGAIIPIGEKIGFQIDGKIGVNSQKRSGNYVASPGVTLSFNSYNYSSTNSFLHASATMHYKVTKEWNAYFGAKYENYFGGITNTVIYARCGYAY